MNKNVIYTAIFGGYDELREPKAVSVDCDFICFSDEKQRSKVWQTRIVERAHKDPTRDARKYKILPHWFLGGYEVSVWVDGNILVRGDVGEIIHKHLRDTNIAAYDHRYARHRDRKRTQDSRNCIYEEAELLLSIAERGRVKDDPELIKAQVDRYQRESYPKERGMLLSTILLRLHNKPDVITAMEAWWDELKRGSKRDQLSFNYIAWKHNLNVGYIPEDARNNKYFLMMEHKK